MDNNTRNFFNCEKNDLGFYHCKYCQFKTNTRTFLHGHFQKFHTQDKQKASLRMCAENYTCKNCTFLTYSLFFLFKHNLSCQQYISSKQKTHAVLCNRFHYRCSDCGFETIHARTLKNHIIRKHTSPEKIEWQKCDKCNYKGKVKANLLKHIRKHEIKEHNKLEKIFYCDRCEYKSNSRSNTDRHIFSKHTARENISQYECNKCNFKTLQKRDLGVHIIRHHTDPEEIEWHECPHCDYKGILKTYLTRHIYSKHSSTDTTKWYQCDQCTYKGKFQSYVRKHIKLQHKNNEEQFL